MLPDAYSSSNKTGNANNTLKNWQTFQIIYPLQYYSYFYFLTFSAIRDAQVKAENDIIVAGDEYVNRIDSVVFPRSISERPDIMGNKISYVRLDKLKLWIKFLLLLDFLFI